MSKVSVIVPAWRAEGFIASAIAAARAQTLSDIEILVIDDASPDATGEAVKKAAEGDPRVRLLTLPANRGAAGARNAGFAEAKGEWLAILDSDDDMAPARLETLLKLAEAEQADIVADDMLLVPAGKPFLNLTGRQSVNLAQYALGNRLFKGKRQTGYLKPMFRSAFLKRHALSYDESVRIGEDYLLAAHALAHSARFVLHPEALYRYSVREGSVSRRMEQGDVQSLIAAEDKFIAAHGDKLSDDERAALAQRRASLDDALAFIGMVDAVKARRFDRVLATAARRPAAMRHFQMPIRARINRLLGVREAFA